jgi:hypothetical protein
MTRYVNNIGISASHNIYRRQEDVDLRESRSIESYLETGRMSTIKFKRSLDGIQRGFDENKFLFPLYTEEGVLPLVSVPIISALNTNPNQVSILGSYEVKNVVSSLKNYFIETNRSELSDKLVFVPEMPEGLDYNNLNRKKLTLFNSVSRLRNSFEGDVPFLFVTGDILAYSFLDSMEDSDILNHDLILDLNAKELINPQIPRNFYNKARRKDGLEVSFKEPNIFTFGDNFPFESVELFYSNREKGGLTNAIKSMVWKYKNNLINFDVLRGFTNIGIEAIVANFIEKREIILDETDAHNAAKVLAPMRIKAEHTDPLRLIDVDGIEDLVMLQNCVPHFSEIFPQDIHNDLMSFSNYFQNNDADSVSVIKKFKDEMNDKVKRIQSLMRVDLAPKLQLPYDSEGNLVLEPRENLDGFIERLIQERQKYEQRHNLQKVA